MQHRAPTAFNTAYNPQQWGLVSSGSTSSPISSSRTTGLRQSQPTRVAVLAARPVGPDGILSRSIYGELMLTWTVAEPAASPPPPYSPRRESENTGSPHQPAEVLSPADTVSPDMDHSLYNTPISAATTVSPDLQSRQHTGLSPTPTPPSFLSESPNAMAAPNFPPPPPSGLGLGVRSLSKNRADWLLSSITSRARTSSTASPVSAIDTLQETTAQAIARAPEAASTDISLRAPAARRAASTGGIGLSGPTSRSASRSPSKNKWEPGMPLPPPPPGPPPSSARSQSLNRPHETPSSSLVPNPAPRGRRPPGLGTSLDPVPPTPADWKEEDVAAYQSSSRSNGPAPLHIDTGSIVRKGYPVAENPITAISTAPPSSQLQRESSSGNLIRSPAVRNRSAKGIRERRSESRNGKGRAVEDSHETPSSSIAAWAHDLTDAKPTDLVLPTSEGGLSRRRTINKSTPRSAKSMHFSEDALNNANTTSAHGEGNAFGSSHSTPRLDSAHEPQFPKSITPTPPFSPSQEVFTKPSSRTYAPPALPPKPLPTPPPQSLVEPHFSPSLDLPAKHNRPLSHLLHMPNMDDSVQAPLQPSARVRRDSALDLLGPESPAAFAKRAIERHRNFAERESSAADDSERLYLFTQFMLAESRIRRDQYSAVFEEETIDIHELTQGLFVPATDSNKVGRSSRNLHVETTTKRKSIESGSSIQDIESRGDLSAVDQVYESPITRSGDSSPQHRPESAWMKDYVPCLSPIASMSIVTGQDEMDSRGRAPSRWWEDNSTGSRNGDTFKVLERSKRESKYMGLPLEARDSPAFYENEVSGSANSLQGYSNASSQHTPYGASEYPPEKASWYQDNVPLPPPPPNPPTPHSAPFTPDPRKLDISRLITLPPPYPRHHPAVNNSHPDLASVRAVVRSLQDVSEVNVIKESYRSKILEKRQRADSWCKHQRSLHNQDVNFRIEQGEISEAQFDQAELEIGNKIAMSDKEVTQADFDLFQKLVVSPLHALFSDRISKATSSFDELRSRLFSDAQQHSPNLPQEEGDEQPELLEKLTQLKWLFEAREALHRQTYDLLSERNEKYKAIVLLPYQKLKNHDKVEEAESFFSQDARDRRLAFERGIFSRSEDFLTVIEGNVTRGVEIQLSAFWDIAPSLLEILQKIPIRLRGFEVQIPPDEYTENPSYYDHPLQYLYSLLGHAEKSSHQFIESQINLLCLLHEIKESTLAARCRVEETACACAAPGAGGGRAWTGEANKWIEEKRLMDDLKEKVGVVEGQWDEAFGGEVLSVRERVREWLLEEGGWDEVEDEV